MKLENKDVSNLVNLSSLATRCGMKQLIIVDGVARLINEGKTCVIISDQNIPKFATDIGISRLDAFQTRMNAFAFQTNVVVNTTDDTKQVVSVEFSAGRSKAQYRCTSVVLLEGTIPKRVADSETAAFIFQITPDEVKQVTDSFKIMGAKLTTLIISEDKLVKFIAADESNDNFVVELENGASFEGEETAAVFSYDVGVFTPLLKEAVTANTSSTLTLFIGARGTLTLEVNGHRVILLPQLNNNDEDD